TSDIDYTISIHAPHTGSDHQGLQRFSIHDNFNPRSPYRERLRDIDKYNIPPLHIVVYSFLSPDSSYNPLHFIHIFLHTLREPSWKTMFTSGSRINKSMAFLLQVTA